MATPPKLRRVTVEDLTNLEPEVRKGISKLLNVLNPFLTSVTSALDRRLTFFENSAAVIKELEFTMPVTSASMTLTGYGTSEWSNPAASLIARRTGNMVRLQGLLTHRSTNLTGFTTPIFKIPTGFIPERTFIDSCSYNYKPASMDIAALTGIVYLAEATDTTPSSHIDISTTYSTKDDLPVHPAPFPLFVDVSSLPFKPTICEVLKIEDLNSKAGICHKPDLAWNVENVQGKNTVKIKRADGLIDGHKYKMTVICTA